MRSEGTPLTLLPEIYNANHSIVSQGLTLMLIVTGDLPVSLLPLEQVGDVKRNIVLSEEE